MTDDLIEQLSRRLWDHAQANNVDLDPKFFVGEPRSYTSYASDSQRKAMSVLATEVLRQMEWVRHFDQDAIDFTLEGTEHSLLIAAPIELAPEDWQP